VSRQSLRVIAIAFTVVVVLPVLACVGIASVQPSSYRIERTRELAVDRAAVHAVLSDVERVAGAFATGEGARATPQIVLSADHSGVGAYFEHRLPDHRTRFTIAEQTEQRVVYDVSIEGQPPQSRFVADLTATPGGSSLTLAIEGPIQTFLQKILWPVVNLEGRVAPELEQTLSAIESAARP